MFCLESRLLSNRSSIRGDVIPSKEERFSVIIPLTSARRTLPVVDTTFVVKLEETKTTEANQSNPVEVAPIESLPTLEAEATSSYSQPKPPARLYFSPTLLQDDDEPELIPPVLSTIDQNRSSMKIQSNLILLFFSSCRYGEIESNASSIWSNILIR